MRLRERARRIRRAGQMVGRAVWRAVAAVGRGIAGEVGRDELLLALGLGLLGYGLTLTPWRPAAFIVPGAVLVWMTLPTRRRFVEAPPAAPAERRPT